MDRTPIPTFTAIFSGFANEQFILFYFIYFGLRIFARINVYRSGRFVIPRVKLQPLGAATRLTIRE